MSELTEAFRNGFRSELFKDNAKEASSAAVRAFRQGKIGEETLQKALQATGATRAIKSLGAGNEGAANIVMRPSGEKAVRKKILEGLGSDRQQWLFQGPSSRVPVMKNNPDIMPKVKGYNPEQNYIDLEPIPKTWEEVTGTPTYESVAPENWKWRMGLGRFGVDQPETTRAVRNVISRMASKGSNRSVHNVAGYPFMKIDNQLITDLKPANIGFRQSGEPVALDFAMPTKGYQAVLDALTTPENAAF